MCITQTPTVSGVSLTKLAKLAKLAQHLALSPPRISNQETGPDLYSHQPHGKSRLQLRCMALALPGGSLASLSPGHSTPPAELGYQQKPVVLGRRSQLNPDSLPADPGVPMPESKGLAIAYPRRGHVVLSVIQYTRSLPEASRRPHARTSSRTRLA